VIDTAERLREAGLRATRRRMAILRTLDTLGGHRTADQLAEALDSAGSPIPRASLYHALGSLADARVLMVADAGPGVARYEIGARWHHHFVCRRCRAIINVPCAAGRQPCLEPDLPGLALDEVQVIYRGLCPSCSTV
jgi:Fe2+ or Zn2+ uptake regulation protein